MKRTASGISLSLYIRRMIWVSMLPFLLLVLWLGWHVIRERQNDLEQEARNLAGNFATNIDHYLNARFNALAMLGKSPLLNDPLRWPELYREAQGFQQSFGSHVILADAVPPRQMLFNTRVPYGSRLPVLPVPKGHAAAPLALATGKPAVGDTFMGPVAGVTLVAIAVPVPQHGAPKFILLSTFEASRFQERVDLVALPPGWSLSLLDGRGDLIVRRGEARAENSGNGGATERFVAQSKHSSWSVVVEIPHRIYYRPIYQAASVMALGILAATLAGMIGGLLAGRRLGQAVDGLSNPQKRLESDICEVEAARLMLDESDQELRHSEERFRRLFHEAPLPLAYVRSDGVLIECNEYFVRILGYTKDDVPDISMWWQKAFPDPVYRETARSIWESELERALGLHTDIRPMEYRITCKDGRERIMLVSGIIIDDAFMSTFFDMTELRQSEQLQSAALAEQKQARLALLNQMEDTLQARQETEKTLEALRESTQKFEATFDQAAVGIAMVSPDGHWLRVNRKLSEIVGYSPDELMQKSFQDITHPDDLHTDLALMQQMLAREISTYSLKKRYIRKDGTIVWIRLNVALVWSSDETPDYFVSVIEDIQKTVDAEASLQEARRLGGLGYWKWDLKTNEHLWTDEIYRIYGCDPSLPPPQYPEVQQYFTPESWKILSEKVETAMQSSTPYSCDAEVIRPDGTHRWITARGEQIRDVRGDIVALHGTVQDISERKQAEEEIQQLNITLEQRVEQRTAELQTANRELDAFAYAVSHDLRAPLRAMNGFSQALEEDLGERLSGNELVYLRQIRQASQQMTELIDALLQLSRSTRGDVSPEQVDISALARQICDELAQQEPERTVQCIIEPGLSVWADPRMIRIMLRNLLGNAWKYTSKRDVAEIRLYRSEHNGLSLFCLEDNGAGFDMRYADKLFQPFHRLHRQDEFSGIGIGLTTAQRIIHRHGGTLQLVAEPDKGAKALFTLPSSHE